MGYFLLRAAGLEGGYRKSPRELEKELTAVKRLLMAWGVHFLPDVFQNLHDHAADDRLLILEWIEGGAATIVGCIAYTLQPVLCRDPATGEILLRRVNMLRILAVQEGPHRGELARRLAFEAQLRGTIRSLYDNEDQPNVYGTVGVMMERNERALYWAARLGGCARIIEPDDPVLDSDPVLRALRDHANAVRVTMGKGEPYRFIVARRRTLVEAAALNEQGRAPFEPADADLRIYYDITEPYHRHIDVAVHNITRNNPATWARLALKESGTSIWGSPAAAGMRLGRPGDGLDWQEFSK